MTTGYHGGPLTADGEHEFRCPRCHARCTESPTKDLEYGHARGCPRRPEELRRWVAGSPYNPDDDPHLQDLATDGGEDRGDD